MPQETLAQVIRRVCPDYKQDYPRIARKLNEETVKANPDAGKKSTAPAPITLEAIMLQVPDAEGAAIYAASGNLIDHMITAINEGNRVWLAKLLGIAAAGGKISTGTKDKLQALLTATVETTAPATIPGPSIAAAAGLGTVTAEQVQTANQTESW